MTCIDGLMVHYFDKMRNDHPEACLPTWQSARVHILLSVPPMVGPDGRNILEEVARSVFTGDHKVHQITLTEPEAATRGTINQITNELSVSLDPSALGDVCSRGHDAPFRDDNAADNNSRKEAPCLLLISVAVPPCVAPLGVLPLFHLYEP
jgi:hypothetical protein